MSEVMNELRADQKTLYPMQTELTQEEQLRLKGGFLLWAMSMSVPVFLLFATRYILVGSYVDPAASWGLGLAGLVLLVVTGILSSAATKAAKAQNRRATVQLYGWAWWFSLAAIVVLAWQVFDGSLNQMSHYGMTFMFAQGFADFYIICAWLAIWAARGRVKRVPAIRNYWGTASTGYFVWFVTIVWVLFYLLLYFL